MSQFVSSFDSSWLRCRRKLWFWISKKIKIYKIGRLRVSNSTFWVLYLETFRSTYVISTLKMQFYEFSLSCHVLKRLLLFTRLSLWRLCSHYLFMSLFPPFFSASKKCDFGKTRARSCWWIVTGMILQEYLETNVWILVTL